jgi:hypothetical protein
LRSIRHSSRPCQPTAKETTVPPARTSAHTPSGTPASTATAPAVTSTSRRSSAFAWAGEAGERSSVCAKWKLHTRIEWVSAPSSTRCSISQFASGSQRCAIATTTAVRNHPISG